MSSLFNSWTCTLIVSSWISWLVEAFWLQWFICLTRRLARVSEMASLSSTRSVPAFGPIYSLLDLVGTTVLITRTLLVHITRTHYSYSLLVLITRTHYSYSLLVLITRTHYSYSLLVLITRTHYSLFQVHSQGLFHVGGFDWNKSPWHIIIIITGSASCWSSSSLVVPCVGHHHHW